ncbi:MAG: tetratricopeptide repeat protein [Candidatus Pacebacteria bacterium]|nr:tetratricopeptide repeat protein [Candidatus Paceibacterota bacterium]
MIKFGEFFKKNIGSVVALLGLGLFLYAFNLHNILFWDDVDWIVSNPSLHALTWENVKFIFTHDVLAGIGQVSNYYRPFLFVTFLFNYIFSGTDPVSYHLVSNGIHVVSALLIFYLLSQWLQSRRAAFIAGLLFLIHPLQTEAVAYISGRGDPLSVMFMLAAMVLYFNRKTWWALIVAVLAVLSRETAVLFPVYLGVALIAFEYKGLFMDRFKKSFIDILPFAGVSVVYGILRLTTLNFQNTLNFYNNQQNIYSENLAYRLYTFFHVILVYLRMIIWPTGLHMDRDIPVSLSIFNGWSWLGLLLILAALVLLIVLYRKEKSKSKNTKLSQRHKSANVLGAPLVSSFGVWFFGLGIFFISLLPTSGIAPINARIYEHWLYFALFGFFSVLAWYLNNLWSWIEKEKVSWRPILVLVVVVYCFFFGVQTIRRNLIWGDTESFYKNILYYEPKDVRVLNNLGNLYSDRGDIVSALPFYQRAVEVDPAQPAPYYNLGNIARDQNRLEDAVLLYKEAINKDKNFHYAYGNIAQIYLKQKRLSEALDYLVKLQAIYPSDSNQKNIEILQGMIVK